MRLLLFLITIFTTIFTTVTPLALDLDQEWFLLTRGSIAEVVKNNTPSKLLIVKKTEKYDLRLLDYTRFPYETWIRSNHYKEVIIKVQGQQEMKIGFLGITYIKDLTIIVETAGKLEINIEPDVLVFAENIRLMSKNGSIIINGRKCLMKVIPTMPKKVQKIPFLKGKHITLVGLNATPYPIEEINMHMLGGYIEINDESKKPSRR